MENDLKTILKDLLDPAGWSGALIYAAVIGLIAWLAGRALGLAIHRVLDKKSKRIPADRTAIRFLGQLGKVGVYVFAFLTYTHLIPSLHSLGTAWLASVGVISVVLGLAAQNTLSNLIAGISMLLYRPFNLGDRLQVMAPTGLEAGVVEGLNLGYTILRTPDNRRVVIPNSLMASQTNVNLSSDEERMICAVPVNISYDADIDKARAVLIELGKNHPKTLEYSGCPVTAVANGSVTLTLRIWCADFSAVTELKYDLLEAAKKRFKAEGIELK
ncbi:MAG: hypothetical protein JWR26_1732 [Pedosphaera sp.]|nr:hypothetical protein [Pedosphaera sp.]